MNKFIFKKWWHILVILELKRLRQEDFEVGWYYVVRSCFKTTATTKDRLGVLMHDHSTWEAEAGPGYTGSSGPLRAT